MLPASAPPSALDVSPWTTSKSGGLRNLRQDRRCDALDVQVRVLCSGTVQPGRLKSAQAVVCRLEADMLAGEDQAGAEIASGECPGDGGELDRFGPGADDEPDICWKQTSPSFGRINLRP